NAEHLQYRRHAGFARAADALALGEIENELRRVGQQALKHLPAVAELLDCVAQPAQHRGDGIDRGRAVELLLKIVGQPGGRGSIGFQIKRDTNTHGIKSEIRNPKSEIQICFGFRISSFGFRVYSIPSGISSSPWPCAPLFAISSRLVSTCSARRAM